MSTQEAGDERPVLILAQDEGCFGRISEVKRAWAPPGMRPSVPVQVVREYVYVYAAVAPSLSVDSMALLRHTLSYGLSPLRKSVAKRAAHHKNQSAKSVPNETRSAK